MESECKKWNRASASSGVNLLGAALTNPICLVILWALAINNAWSVMTALRSRVNKHDFSVYYLSATALRKHHDPYTSKLNSLGAQFDLQVGDLDQATDPPTFLLLYESLTFLRPTEAYWVWTILNLACLIAVLLMLQTAIPLKIRLLLFPLALLYAPVSSHFHWGQSKLPLLLLLVAMMKCLEHGWEPLSGIILAIASLTRMFPLLLAGYLLLQKKWKAIWYFGLGLFAFSLLTLVLAGGAQTFHFIYAASFLNTSKWTIYSNNISLRAFIFRVFRWSPFLQRPSLDSMRRAIILVAQLGMLAITTYLTLLRSRGKDSHWRLFSLWIASSIMLSPIAWDHDMVLLLVLFYKVAGAAVQGQASRRTIYTSVTSYLCAGSLFILSETGLWPSNWLLAGFAEKDFVAMATAYVSAYWFVRDVSIL